MKMRMNAVAFAAASEHGSFPAFNLEIAAIGFDAQDGMSHLDRAESEAVGLQIDGCNGPRGFI